MKAKFSRLRPALVLVFLAVTGVLAAESSVTDTLSLRDAVEKALQLYPTVKLSLEATRAADARVAMAKTGYYPDIDLSASYSRVGPVPEFDFPSFGHIQLFPENNYAAALNIQQNLSDFGRTSKRIAAEQESKAISEESAEIVRQHLTKRVISVYYTLLYLQEAVKIKDQQIVNLREHLSLITKKQETGSATDYEVLSTQVRLTAAESQKTDLESLLNIQAALLNSLLGQNESNTIIVSAATLTPADEQTADSVIARALNNRYEIKMANSMERLMQMRISLVRTDNNPVVKLFASAGGKNGYVPETNKIKANYTAGIGLRIPLYDASRTRNNLSLAKSSLMTSQYEKELTVLDITNEVVEYYHKENAAIKKVDQSAFQVQQAERAYELASTSYNAGVITNLDLLDATFALSESRLMLLKSRIEYLISYYGLRLAEGNQIFTDPLL